MEQLELFLLQNGMHPDCIDMESEIERFRSEMLAGLGGDPSSLMMLPAYLNPAANTPRGQQVVVLDAGGTNLRIAQVMFQEDGPHILSENKQPVPGSSGELTWDQFLEALAKAAAPHAKDTEYLGFCFSFPANITEKIDGQIINFNKEVRVTGAEGHLMCRELTALLNRKYGCHIRHFALLNDTVAALMGGFASARPDQYDGYIGFILGTGMNCCYVEPKRQMIVNLEAGGYDGFPLGTYDHILDSASVNPGDHHLEKMVSGGYLGGVIGETLLGAGQSGFLSASFVRGLQESMPFDLSVVSAYLEDPGGDNPLANLCACDADRLALWNVVCACVNRAAKLVAVALTAILEQMDTGRFPWKPACIVAEGSAFWKCDPLRQMIARYMDDLARKYGRYYRFTTVEDANLCGAAAAALLISAVPD